jgi:capsid protein
MNEYWRKPNWSANATGEQLRNALKEAIDYIDRCEKTLAEAAIPLETMNIVGQKTMGISDDLWQGIHRAIMSIRQIFTP